MLNICIGDFIADASLRVIERNFALMAAMLIFLAGWPLAQGKGQLQGGEFRVCGVNDASHM